jgi:hypothetical protein
MNKKLGWKQGKKNHQTLLETLRVIVMYTMCETNVSSMKINDYNFIFTVC